MEEEEIYNFSLIIIVTNTKILEILIKGFNNILY